MARTSINRTRGLIFIELWLVMVMITLTSTFFYASWKNFITQQWFHSLAIRLIEAVKVTQEFALVTQHITILCASDHPPSCQTNWDRGFIIKYKKEILHRYPPLPEGFHLMWKSNFNQNTALRFNADGFTDGQQGTFYLCAPIASLAVIVSRSGRLRFINKSGYSCPSKKF